MSAVHSGRASSQESAQTLPGVPRYILQYRKRDQAGHARICCSIPYTFNMDYTFHRYIWLLYETACGDLLHESLVQ